MFNSCNRVVLFPLAKLNKNKSKSSPYHYRNPKCTHKKDHTKNYFVSKIDVLKNRNISTNTITKS